MTFTQIDEYPDGSFGPVRTVDVNGHPIDLRKHVAFTFVTQEMWDDSEPLRQALLDVIEGPRYGPGRAEWQALQPRTIVTVRHGRNR